VVFNHLKFDYFHFIPYKGVYASYMMELHMLILGKWALNKGDLVKILMEGAGPRSLI